jgi:hypothetical protein
MGYTAKDIKEHIERLFTKEMSWANYGSYWQIHHILPSSYFNYSSIDHPEFKLCWNLSNLMPLEKTKNLELGILWCHKQITLEQHVIESLKCSPLYKKESVC